MNWQVSHSIFLFFILRYRVKILSLFLWHWRVFYSYSFKWNSFGGTSVLDIGFKGTVPSAVFIRCRPFPKFCTSNSNNWRSMQRGEIFFCVFSWNFYNPPTFVIEWKTLLEEQLAYIRHLAHGTPRKHPILVVQGLVEHLDKSSIIKTLAFKVGIDVLSTASPVLCWRNPSRPDTFITLLLEDRIILRLPDGCRSLHSGLMKRAR